MLVPPSTMSRMPSPLRSPRPAGSCRVPRSRFRRRRQQRGLGRTGDQLCSTRTAVRRWHADEEVGRAVEIDVTCRHERAAIALARGSEAREEQGAVQAGIDPHGARVDTAATIGRRRHRELGSPVTMSPSIATPVPKPVRRSHRARPRSRRPRDRRARAPCRIPDRRRRVGAPRGRGGRRRSRPRRPSALLPSSSRRQSREVPECGWGLRLGQGCWWRWRGGSSRGWRVRCSTAGESSSEGREAGNRGCGTPRRSE